MKQSRLMSLVESVANVIVGYGVAVVTQILIFPIFGLHTTLEQNLKMGAVFTGVSIVRSYALRRVFEAIRIRSVRRLRRHTGLSLWSLETQLSNGDPFSPDHERACQNLQPHGHGHPSTGDGIWPRSRPTGSEPRSTTSSRRRGAE